MINVIKKGFRKDLDNYFIKYLFTRKLQISPLIVIDKDKVYCLKETEELFKLHDKVVILHTWPGKYHSDVFMFTIEQMKAFVEENPNVLKMEE